MAKPAPTLSTTKRPHSQGRQRALAKVVTDTTNENELLNGSQTNIEMTQSKYLPTPMAARHLGHSESWLLRRGDIPYLPGRPNMYAVRDLDTWFERNKWAPKD
jgi:hypothetical protein